MSNDNSAKSEWVGAVVKSMWRINPKTHQYFEFSCGWGTTIAATVKKNKIFCILEDGTVWRIDPAFGEFLQIKNLTGWETCLALTAHGDHLYAFCKALYRITVKNGSGSYEKVSDDWGNTKCATTLGSHLYAITQNGKLWQINPTDGTYKQLSTGFEDTKAITSHNGKLYTFGDQIRRIDPSNPSAEEKVSAGWKTTLPNCATVVNGVLWAVTESGKVWKINPETGTYEDSGLKDWGNTKALFSVTRNDNSNIENQVNEPSSDGYDIFLSHRQLTGGDLAMNIKLLLLQENPNLRIFLDVDDLHDVHNLEENVKNSRNVILLVTEGALDRPFVQLEIRTGLQHKKNFVLVHDPRSCNFPVPATLPEDIREVATVLAVPWMREKVFRDVSVKEIMKRLI